MTSQVNPNNIDGTYPVAGQDNDSQGFRDNFTNIRNNLTFAKAEIEDLQNKAVLKSALLNSVLSNDFAGEAIVNPSLTGYRETYNSIGAVSGSITINFINGNFQKITMAGSTILTFSFPPNTIGQYASIKLWVSNPSSSYILSFPDTLTLGDPDTVSGFSGNSITFSAAEISNSTDYYFEIFTVDGGTTLGIRDLMRNRDFDGNSLSISGDLTGISEFSATGNTILGKVINATIGSNVVIRSNITSITSTNQALVVSGGGGFAGNLVVDGNLWITSGNIRTGTQGNIFNISTTTIGFGNAASFISMGAASSNVLVNGGITVVGNITTSANLITSYVTSAIGSGNNITIEPDGAGDIILGASTTSNVVINATTASTSTTTGALVVTGGAGVSGAIYNGGVHISSGNIVAASGTASVSTTTGALVVAGGVGISGSLFIAGVGDVSANIGSLSVSAGGGIDTISANLGSFQTYANSKIGTNTNSNLVAASGTASTSTTTGALVVTGGAGVSGAIYNGGVHISSGNIVAASGTASTSTTTGALVVTGGAGVSGALSIGGIIDAAGNIVAASGTASTSTTTGALVVTGGAGVSGALFVGGIIDASGNIVADSGTVSTSTTTGALVVRGGAGITGNVNLGVGSTTVVPLAFAATQTTGGNVNVPIQGAIEANLGVGATGTAANVFYATPTSSTSTGRALIPVQHTFVLGGNTSMNGGVAFTGGAEYPVFGGAVTAGAWVGNVMLAAGTTYEFEIKAMGAFAVASTSSTLALRFVGNATVTYSNYETMVIGVGGTTTTAPSVTEHYGTTTLPTTTAAGAAAYTNFMVRAKGIIRINGQGTLNPCYVFATGPAQVLTAVQGSYMRWTPIGTASNIAIGTTMGGAWAGGIGY